MNYPKQNKGTNSTFSEFPVLNRRVLTKCTYTEKLQIFLRKLQSTHVADISQGST